MVTATTLDNGRAPVTRLGPQLALLAAVGASSAAAHIGNNFTTYLVGGLIDRFAFTATQMGAWSMVETLCYAAAMFGVAPRVAAVSPRGLAGFAALLVVGGQLSSAVLASYPLLLATRMLTGFGFGLLNASVNLAAGRTRDPARTISIAIGLQVMLFSAVNVGLPMVGEAAGVTGMFVALAALSAVLAIGTFWLPRSPGAAAQPDGVPKAALGVDAVRILAAMALFAFGSLAIWPFMERAARTIGVSSVEFGRYQGLATLTSALGSFGLVAIVSIVSRRTALVGALVICGASCALMTTVTTALPFAVALVTYNLAWFITYSLLLGYAFAVDRTGRLAVLTTGTWLLAQSIGSLGAGIISDVLGGYTLVGPLGLITCVSAIGVIRTLAGRIDRLRAADAASADVTA